MGVMDWLRPWRSSDANAGVATSWPVLDYLMESTEGKTTDDLWKEQPHLRTVVGFLTRNVAQLDLKPVKISRDGTRKPITSGPLADTMSRWPNPDQSWYSFREAIVGDLALYDNAYILKVNTPDYGMTLRVLRPIWIQGVIGLDAWGATEYVVKFPEDTKTVTVPAENIHHIHGYSPMDPRVGVSPVAALKTTLAEQIHASVFRSQLWKRGGRVGSYLTRPADAPKWDPEARAKFKREFASQWSGDNGSKAGGVPLFEDGLEMKRVGFSARDEQFVEATTLSLQTVAAVYYINPTMVGILDNANYSNVREFRRMLYGETLGPLLEQLSQELTAAILRWLELPTDGKTVLSFDVEGRTAGTFEEQMGVAGTAVGGPVMTVNEFRARIGMAPIDGGDELNQPLNNANNGGDPEEVPAGPADDQPSNETPPPPTDEGGNTPPDDEPKTGAPDALRDLDPEVTKALEGSHA